MKIRYTKEGVFKNCANCTKRIEPENAFLWLVNGKPANIRFCSAKCMAEYCSTEDEEASR